MVTGSSGANGLRKCIEVTCLENLNVDTGAHSFIIFLATNDSCPKQDQSLKGSVAHHYLNFP